MKSADTRVCTVARRGQVAYVRPGASAREAAETMRRRGIGSLLVLDAAGRVVGILSERDIVNRLAARGADPNATTAGEIMTTEVGHCTPQTPITEANDQMLARHIRHLPVVEDERAVGMLSIRDVLAYQLDLTTAMTSAAEQTGRFVKFLKSLDFDEVLNVIGAEVPKAFGAGAWMLCVLRDDAEEPLDIRGRCPACWSSEESRCRAWAKLGEAQFAETPEITCPCARSGPRALIPLRDCTAHPGGAEGFLCMCGLPSVSGVAEEVRRYKGGLMQEILIATLTNTRLYAEARRRSRIDGLTGLQTRRTLEEQLREAYERGVRYKRPFCVAVVDVDKFKQVNDTHGHAAGDETLRRLGDLMCDSIRATDLAVRYGGDEFVLLLPETPLDPARRMLERLRRRVVEGVRTPDGEPVTISCGIAQFQCGTDHDGQSVFRRADAALYDAKRRGRNAVAAPVPA